jgi:hypothetical protein
VVSCRPGLGRDVAARFGSEGGRDAGGSGSLSMLLDLGFSLSMNLDEAGTGEKTLRPSSASILLAGTVSIEVESSGFFDFLRAEVESLAVGFFDFSAMC